MNFTSQSEMIGFIRGLSKDADYATLLRDDFGVTDVPADADPFKKEYFYKYLVQGQYMGLENEDLFLYAKNNVYGFERKFPWVAHSQTLTTTASSTTAPKKAAKYVDPKTAKRGQRTCRKHTGPDGSAKFIEHRGVWIGFWGNKVVVTRKTEEAIMEFFKNYKA